MLKQQILATGAIGLVGSRFLDMFQAKYEVANIDIASGVDITDKASVEQFIVSHPATTLIHLAAFTDTNRAFAETDDKTGLCYRVNVLGTQNIAELCRDHHIHLIHVSTDFVFDGLQTTPYLEESPLSPIEWYGSTKAMAEEVVKTSGVSYSIARLSYPYRAHFPAKPDIIQKIRLGLESGKLYPQFSDTVITPTFIDDIARGFDQLITLHPQGIFHLVGSDSLSPYSLAQKVATAYDFDPSLVKEGSLTQYLKTASLASTSDGESRRAARPFARHVAMSNAHTSQALDLHFATVDTGLEAILAQQVGL